MLVNNAGIMQIGRFIDEDDLTARRMIDINLHGVILGMKLALERMIPRNRGHIINISSQAGKYGAPGGATYSATKHAVVGLTEAVRGELRLMGANVDLSYVMPFAVKTELGAGLGDARGMKHLEPREVADRIVEALQYRIVEVWVPKSASRNQVLAAVLPRSISEGFARALKADRVLAGADFESRRNYELRASRSEPGLEGPPPQPQLGGATTAAAPAPVASGTGLYEAAVEVEAEAEQPGPCRPRWLGRAAARRRRLGASGEHSRRRRRACAGPTVRVSHSAISSPISGPWSSCRKWLAFSIVRGRSRPIASAKRSPVASGITGSESAHSISVGRRSSRSASSTRCPASAPGASGVRRQHQRKRPRPRLRGGVGIGRFVGRDHLVAGVGLAGAPHEHPHGQVLGALRRSRETRSTRRSSSGAR